MKVYLVRASEWETDVNCVCSTYELAERERMRLANEYGIENNDWEWCIEIVEMQLIEE